MPETLNFDRTRTAPLSLDCQAGIISIDTRESKDAFLTRTATVLSMLVQSP